jgi:type 1 fimbriae regulatory protein FimB/type 1 fimbriae regulatory protein FimE
MVLKENHIVAGTRDSTILSRKRFLTPPEMARLLDVAQQGSRGNKRPRNRVLSIRDTLMIRMAYIHGLRASELVGIQWNQIDLVRGTVHISRLKNGISTEHPLTAIELRALKRLRRLHPHSRFVFLSNRDAPMTRANFNLILSELGRLARFDFPLHPHMLRHACGYKLANDGRDTRSLQHYLGHRNIQSTVGYTQLNSNRFNGWWEC